ncbi:response regulator [Tepidamorphus sp. 3E244]|uniref:response regulator n=1 Tax=Tepidamorphus sp. 3E244 TaxID=3385498 RepID=UPI0038FCE8BA
MRIIIVEDDSAVRESMLLLLRQMDFDPSAYESAEAFLADVQPAPQDAVLVDLGLPGISGTQLISQLKSLQHPPHIVVMTGSPLSALRREMPTLKDVSLLRKPLEPETLNTLLTGLQQSGETNGA